MHGETDKEGGTVDEREEIKEREYLLKEGRGRKEGMRKPVCEDETNAVNKKRQQEKRVMKGGEVRKCNEKSQRRTFSS